MKGPTWSIKQKPVMQGNAPRSYSSSASPSSPSPATVSRSPFLAPPQITRSPSTSSSVTARSPGRGLTGDGCRAGRRACALQPRPLLPGRQRAHGSHPAPVLSFPRPHPCPPPRPLGVLPHAVTRTDARRHHQAGRPPRPRAGDPPLVGAPRPEIPSSRCTADPFPLRVPQRRGGCLVVHDCAAAEKGANWLGGLTRAWFPKVFVFRTANVGVPGRGRRAHPRPGPSIWDSFAHVPGMDRLMLASLVVPTLCALLELDCFGWQGSDE